MRNSSKVKNRLHTLRRAQAISDACCYCYFCCCFFCRCYCCYCCYCCCCFCSIRLHWRGCCYRVGCFCCIKINIYARQLVQSTANAIVFICTTPDQPRCPPLRKPPRQLHAWQGRSGWPQLHSQLVKRNATPADKTYIFV